MFRQTMMRAAPGRYTGGRDWVVLGMEYHERGLHRRSSAELRAALVAEGRTLHRAVSFVTREVRVDPRRVYLAGFSKGGWWTSLLGEQEVDRVAGMIIPGAGRPPDAR